MRRIIVIFLIASAAFSSVDGQALETDISVSLQKLFGRLIASTEDEDRIRINDSIKIIIGGYADSDSVFTHKFENLRYLGQITSDNSRLKILTWNLLLRNSKSRYFCYFIHSSGKGNQTFALEGTYREEPIRSDTIYSAKDWYGALYYDLRAVKKANQVYWVLLGIDYGNPSVTRKVIEVLKFDPDGRIIFGDKIFSPGESAKYREVFEYSPEAVMSLKFRSDKSIVFDHLVPVSPAFTGQKEYYGPDYSYDAYNLEKGLWRFEKNIDVRNKKQ